MYILDTNICIYAMKNTYPHLSQKLLRIDPAKIFISSITVGELEYGCAKSRWGEHSRNIMHLFLSAYTILPFDQKDAVSFGKLRALLAANGSPIGPYDMQIAAQGVARSIIVVTHNTSEFIRVSQLMLEDWTIQ